MAASNARAAQIQIRLEKLNQTVRGHHLPPADYRNLCDEQRALREEKNAANTIASDLRVRLAQLRREYEQVKDLRPDKLLLTNRLLKAILVELRELNGKGNGGGK